MSALLTLNAVAASTPTQKKLFNDLFLTLGKERVGLVGNNGSGKSTLIRILAGLARPAAGSIQRFGSTGLLAQDWPEESTIAQVLGVEEPLAILQRLTLGNGDERDFEAADWDLELRLQTALAEVDIAGIPLDRLTGSLSGGERVRIGIARLLIEEPDLLLLDEPTNNLDTNGRALIQSLISKWQGGVLVASHDRELLESMERIVELTPIKVRSFVGGWTAFAAEREAERQKAEAELRNSNLRLKEVKHTAQRKREAKDRRDKAGRAMAAKGSAPKILLGAQAERAENSGARARHESERQVNDAAANAERARTNVVSRTPITIPLSETGLPPKAHLLSLEDVTVEIGERRFGPWTLSVHGPERIAIAGPNGSGKTTLLRVATGSVQSATGKVHRAEGRIAILDQHLKMLDRDESVLTNFRRLNPSLSEREAYARCAQFAFRNTFADRQVRSLSGGERMRAGLACLLAAEQTPWLLILDEPTNHVDIESVELLENALSQFDGALMIVSHDSAFCKAIGVKRTFNVG